MYHHSFRVHIFGFGFDNPSSAAYFSKRTEELIKTESFKHVGKGVGYVDIVKDDINLILVHYMISQELVGLVNFLCYAKFSDLLCRLDFL